MNKFLNKKNIVLILTALLFFILLFFIYVELWENVIEFSGNETKNNNAANTDQGRDKNNTGYDGKITGGLGKPKPSEQEPNPKPPKDAPPIQIYSYTLVISIINSYALFINFIFNRNFGICFK